MKCNAIKLLQIVLIMACLPGLFMFTACRESARPIHDKAFLAQGFVHPPDSVRPGVYWYFMDGNMSREAMTADLESMKEAGIGSVLFLEVNLGLPRGEVDFMSQEWMDMFRHARDEAERLGITMKLGIGPGWSGSGGPWVEPGQSMQFLVSSFSEFEGKQTISEKLPRPQPMTPLFGEWSLTDAYKEIWSSWFKDVAVIAFPAPSSDFIPVDFSNKSGHEIYGGLRAIPSYLPDFEEKALYYRPAFSSHPGVKPFLPSLAAYPEISPGVAVDKSRIIDISKFMDPDGTLNWDVPEGRWIVMRFARVNNGNLTRPAPFPGLGFEADKFDTIALNSHFSHFVERLLPENIIPYSLKNGGITMLHMDSWEMGTQNWTAGFRDEFMRRRGYDPLPFLPAYSGIIVESTEMTERFLWDMRLTAQELVIENHAGHVKTIARRHGLRLSIEPYDINPTADLDLGAVADVPMCEFWLKNQGFNTTYSCVEAVSIGHVLGKPVVAAEAFTACGVGFSSWPGSLKDQGDWAFAAGINHFYYHTFSHKPYNEKFRPGMTMGNCGVHWDRGQTWWPMSAAYHQYIARCSFMLQQGQTVADILYLTPEGAPHVFVPPVSALEGEPFLPDRRGFNFDGCSPDMLIRYAQVKNNQIVFESGAAYKLLLLPAFDTMTPELLSKIEMLVSEGAVVVGAPPRKAPGLTNYPECDRQVRLLAEQIWGTEGVPATITERKYGKGKIYWGGKLAVPDSSGIYPRYEATAEILRGMGLRPDFESDIPARYTHKRTGNLDVYFISNTTGQKVSGECLFNVSGSVPELWDPVSGEMFALGEYSQKNGQTQIPVTLDAWQSYFVVFDKQQKSVSGMAVMNFSDKKVVMPVDGPWTVHFDPELGGPAEVIFDELQDWSLSKDPGIRFYSGIATYQNNFNWGHPGGHKLYLRLGEVNCIARVRLNGQDLGVVWCPPWQIDATGALRQGDNSLEIEVANLWINRLVGDESLPDDGIKDGKLPGWFTGDEPRTSGRFAFSAHKFYAADSPLAPSGLTGPVEIVAER